MRGNPLFAKRRHAHGETPGTRFFCKKPVPEPSGKNSKWLAVYQRGMQVPWLRLIEKHIGVFGEGFGEGVFAKTSSPITLPSSRILCVALLDACPAQKGGWRLSLPLPEFVRGRELGQQVCPTKQ